MRVLMINANRFKQPWPVIPFGLIWVASCLEQEGHEVQVLDLCFSRHCARDIRTGIKDFQPEIVGVSIRNIDNSAGYNTLFLLDETRDRVIRPLKKVFHGPIVIGGPAVGINGAEMLSYLDLPYAIRGDGEKAMLEFVKRHEQGSSLAGMQGLVRRAGGRIVEDRPPMIVPDLDALPVPNPERFIDLSPYRRFDSPLQIQTKRGCALNCSYCTYNRIEGRRYRLRSPESIADEIECLVRETGIEHLEFTDSTFNVPLDHAKGVLEALIAKDMKLKLRTMGLNPGFVDLELVDLMQRAGFRDVDLGAEAGSEAMLASLGKGFTTQDILQAAELLHAKSIPVTWYLLVGAPGETGDTLRETFEVINRAASKWDLVNVGVGIRVYKGSPVADKLLHDHPACTRDGFLSPVHFEPEALSLEDVKRITKQEALKWPNYFMYDEDENTPPALLMLGVSLLRMIAPRQPIFRIHILLRTVQEALGIGALKRWVYARGLKYQA